MPRIAIYLRGGQTIQLDVERFAVKRNGANDVTGVEWTIKDGIRPGDNPLYFRLADISAVIEVR